MKRARQALDSLAPWSRQPSDAELFALRSRFGDAVRNLDVVEVRFDNGLVSVKALADAYVAAAEALKRPSDVRFVSANSATGRSPVGLVLRAYRRRTDDRA